LETRNIVMIGRVGERGAAKIVRSRLNLPRVFTAA
jgi:hypothetical protein